MNTVGKLPCMLRLRDVTTLAAAVAVAAVSMILCACARPPATPVAVVILRYTHNIVALQPPRNRRSSAAINGDENPPVSPATHCCVCGGASRKYRTRLYIIKLVISFFGEKPKGSLNERNPARVLYIIMYRTAVSPLMNFFFFIYSRVRRFKRK